MQVFLAGEGIFGLNNIKNSDDCDKSGAQCIANSKTLDPHRALGFFLTLPGALLFLIVALLAWHGNKRIRTVSIVLPILLFIQMILPGLGRWVAALHPVNRDPHSRACSPGSSCNCGARRRPNRLRLQELRSPDVELRDVAPGLWLWRREYPDWRPEAGWEPQVASTCVESGGEVVLLDPLAPPDDAAQVWARSTRAHRPPS